MGTLWDGLKALLLATAIFLGLSLNGASAEPTTIRVGIGSAVEEQLWLMLARPDLTPGQGKDYLIEYTRFPGADKRFQAFEAGALDIATASANSAIFAAAEGIDFKFIASLSRESQRGFFTKFITKEESGIKTVADLKGHTIGINGFSGSGHLWTKVVLESNGLTESDVTLVPLPFPAQGEALASGTVDVGMFPQPFAQMVEQEGKTHTVYTSKDAAPYEEELMLLIAKDEFLTANADAVKSFLRDLTAMTKYYNDNPTEARQALIDAKFVRTSPDIYLNMPDYYRDPGNAVDVKALEAMQALQIKAGFQKNEVDLASRVDLSYLP